jgi:hypothetical protein
VPCCSSFSSKKEWGKGNCQQQWPKTQGLLLISPYCQPPSKIATATTVFPVSSSSSLSLLQPVFLLMLILRGVVISFKLDDFTQIAGFNPDCWQHGKDDSKPAHDYKSLFTS